MKSGTLELMKFKLLMRDLGESIRGVAGLLEVLWQRACKDCPRGDIGQFSNEEIAVMADYEGDANALVAALVKRRWLDHSDKYRLVIHDWHDHAPNYVKGFIGKKGGFVTCENQPTTPSATPDDGSHDAPSQALVAKPSLTLPSQASPSQAASRWPAAVAAVRGCGVELAEQACESAKANGVSAAEVLIVCEHFQSRPGAWSPGFLHALVSRMRGGERVNWPPPSEIYLERQKRIEKQTERESKIAKQHREREERRAAREAAEADLAASGYDPLADFKSRTQLEQTP